MSVKNTSIEAYGYELPEDRIALYPLEQRDSSKLLLFKEGKIEDHIFSEIPDLLPEKSLLLYNDTKVIHARILFQKSSGARIEIFCLEPANLNYAEAFGSKENSTWLCMVGNLKRWKGEVLEYQFSLGNESIVLRASLIEKDGARASVKFSWSHPDLSFGRLLWEVGKLPIPPYLNREAEEKDEQSYQTYFAREEGSVAAPTAGLHFTEKVMATLEKKQILGDSLTLHVGAGTFLPVKSETMEGHVMHRESIQVKKSTLQKILYQLENNLPIVAVGTTSLRTLESLYWQGVKLKIGSSQKASLEIEQWDPYEINTRVSSQDAIKSLISALEKEGLEEVSGNTRLLILPGYDFKLVNMLITNFHQPNSTLLLLVSAFVGPGWKKIYEHALQNNYRFLSFGDSSLLHRT